MASLIDRLLIFMISILMFNVNQVDYITVCLILVVVIMESIIMYNNNRRVVQIIAVTFAITTFVKPQMAAFYPLMMYEVVRFKIYSAIPPQVVVCIIACFTSFEYSIVSRDFILMLVSLIVGIVIGFKADRENKYKMDIHNMRDEQSYLELKNRQSKDELIRKQDYEVHAATLTERNRIAREIHDHVGHMLSRSILQLGAILAINKDEKLAVPLRGLKDTLDTAMNNIRESVHDLKDDALDLEYMVNEVIREYEMLDIEFDYDMGQYLSKEIKYCCIAIVKEALTNTVKHSDGNRVSIVMREHPALYQVLIEDNGSCMNTNVDKTGIGLDNMTERVGAFGGNIRFSSDNGFKIFISIPKTMK